ncbi:YheC/YheD family protein [Cohnella sp. JJ-181]|uniref:YheC/YheD family endospore coat-associated protein n=1 Tax=Cohnella rhizoplanae TaxID=2974897 RepID=UPI0022FFBF71|nr:YheC/YheD family protein [Cohnella sp. JJ-181]CAI6082210.1 Endospore coat-associated protein YheD [Cohnella sp. JJ-181]
MAAQPTLGILTLYLNERKALEEKPVYARMTAIGRKLGLTVFVFTPDDVDEDGDRIHALFYHPESRSWDRKWVRFPQLIYDRCRIQRSSRFQRLLAFRRKYGHLTFLNRPLRNKWTVHRTLGKVAAFESHLPATRFYDTPEDVHAMLRKHSLVYVKPINGTGGRGILRVERMKDGSYAVQGRDHGRRIVTPRRVSKEQLSGVLRSWDKHGDRYIAQQGLHIRLPSGRVHDYRMLVQKNGEGEWTLTGCAGRVGPPRSITSNLHGGGRAVPMKTLLREWIGSEERIGQIRRTAETLGIGVARHLERTYGALCELALDLAIDREGRVWLLEVNPKPSREVFIQAGERDVYRTALTRPLEYAQWLHRQRRLARTGKSRTVGGVGTGSGGAGGNGAGGGAGGSLATGRPQSAAAAAGHGSAAGMRPAGGYESEASGGGAEFG